MQQDDDVRAEEMKFKVGDRVRLSSEFVDEMREHLPMFVLDFARGEQYDDPDEEVRRAIASCLELPEIAAVVENCLSDRDAESYCIRYDKKLSCIIESVGPGQYFWPSDYVADVPGEHLIRA